MKRPQSSIKQKEPMNNFRPSTSKPNFYKQNQQNKTGKNSFNRPTTAFPSTLNNNINNNMPNMMPISERLNSAKMPNNNPFRNNFNNNTNNNTQNLPFLAKLGNYRKNLNSAKPYFSQSKYKPKLLNPNQEEDLDLVYLIMKNSPQKYDLDKLNEKFKSINNFYKRKVDFDNQLNKIDSTYYKYNLLYGSNAVNLIRSYSPKMRPDSGNIRSVMNYNGNIDNPEHKCFTDDEVKLLFIAKCADLAINPKDNLESKFIDYCDKKCIDRYVDFRECNLSVNSSEVLSIILSETDKIARLNLSRNNLGDMGIENLMNGIKENKSVVHLDISSCNLSSKGGNIVFTALRENESVISLNICSKEGLNRNRLTPEGVHMLEPLLQTNQFLEFLNLSGVNLKNEGLKIVLSGLNNNRIIHSLNLSNNEITHEGMIYFNRLLNQPNKLVSLNLSENPLKNEGIFVLAECLNKQQFSTLKCLELNKCKFDFIGFRKIFEYLQGNKRLEILKCNYNNFKSKEDFESIKPAFSNLNLKELELSSCRLGNKAARILAEGLTMNNTIQKLVIPDNNIDDRGFKYFVDIPEKNFVLQHLDVSKNQITDFSANPFVKNLEKNRHLKEIHFFDNQLKNETGTSLIEVLRVNPHIQRINLKFNGLQVRTLDEIARQLKNNREIIKVKKIPNLRKEIRQTYVTNQDFEVIDLKIKEAALNYQNINEKLKEEMDKYDGLKVEELDRLKGVKEDNSHMFVNYGEMEEKCKMIRKEINKEIAIFEKEIENKKKENLNIQDEIELINNEYKDFKKLFDKKKLEWKDETNKITKERREAYESHKRKQGEFDVAKNNLEILKLAIDKAENPDKYALNIEEKEGSSMLLGDRKDSQLGRTTSTFMQRKGSVVGKRGSIISSEKGQNKIEKDAKKNKSKGKGVSKGKSNKKLADKSGKNVIGSTTKITVKKGKGSKKAGNKEANKDEKVDIKKEENIDTNIISTAIKNDVNEKDDIVNNKNNISSNILNNINTEISQLSSTKVFNVNDKNLIKEATDYSTVKSKIDTKPEAQLKPREKYEIKKPNV